VTPACCARPSSPWRYLIDPLPGGASGVRQRFTRGLDGLQANMSVTLRAMKAAAESSPATHTGPG
jgi:hypothetical protein